MPTLAVVLNWCAEEDTARCLEALFRQRATMPALDVLLADSASPDGSGERLAARFPHANYLPVGANLGYAGGNQRAIEWALQRGYAYILLVNDDAEVMPGCVPRLVATMAANDAVGACAPTITHGPPHHDCIWWAGGRFVWWKGLGVHERVGQSASDVLRTVHTPRPVTFVSGCVLLLRAAAIRRSGGLRPEFFAYVEDAELGVRWQRDGWRLLWVPHAVARHHVAPGSPTPSAFAAEWRDRNRVRLAELHFSAKRQAVFLGCFTVTRMALIVGALLRHDAASAQVLRTSLRGALRSARRRFASSESP